MFPWGTRLPDVQHSKMQQDGVGRTCLGLMGGLVMEPRTPSLDALMLKVGCS